MVNLKCNQCSYTTGTKPTKSQADLALRMHHARMHAKTVTVPGQTKDRTVAEPKPKRKYNHRTQPETEEQPFYVIKFCPQCGMNIGLMMRAARLAIRLKNLTHARRES